MTAITEPLPKRIPGAALNQVLHQATSTTEPMSHERLARIRKVHASATPGPWHFYKQYGPFFLGHEHHGYLNGIGQLEFGEGDQAKADRAFVRQSPEFVAELLAEVDRLRSACRNPDFTCLSGEYCDGCQASDDARTAMERELRDLREENARLRSLQAAGAL